MINRAHAWACAESLGLVGLVGVVATLLAAAGCGGSSGPAMGHEKGPCYGNGTCDTGLVCLSTLCVKGNATGTAGADGGAGTGGAGTAGTSGTAGAGTAGASGTAGAGTAGASGTAGAAGAGTAGANGTAGAGTAGADGGAGAGGTTGTDASADGAGGTGGAAPTCATYCDTIMANCTGDSAQYTTAAECAAACPAFPISTIDVANNTLGCRLDRASAAATQPSACAAAGPSGGGVCGSDPCVPYCELESAHCPTQAGANCVANCHGAFQTDTTAYSAAASSGQGTVYCYLAFAALASVAPDAQCGHTIPNPTTCKN